MKYELLVRLYAYKPEVAGHCLEGQYSIRSGCIWSCLGVEASTGDVKLLTVPPEPGFDLSIIHNRVG